MNDNKRNPGDTPPQETPGDQPRQQTGERAKEEQQLDDSIDDSFPASDPSSVTRAPRNKRYAVEAPKEGADRQTPAHPGPEA